MDFESTEKGYIAKILLPSKSEGVPINKPIAILVSKKEDVAKFSDYSADAKPEKSEKPKAQKSEKSEKPEKSEKSEQAEKSEQPEKTPSKAAPKAREAGGRVVASPLAKSLGAQYGIDLSQITGTGPNDRIIKADVLEFQAAQKAAPAQATKTESKATADQKSTPASAPTPAADGTYTDTPVSNIRRVTAQRLLQSKQTIPHYYLTMDMRVDKINTLRAELNALGNGKFKISINDFIIKAAALALQKVPAVNSSWNDKFIRQFKNVDISVAVNTDQGLFTPIVKDADKRGLADIANTVKTLADKAKANKLAPAEFQGGTFTISNLGMFGIKHFAAVINPPQAAILAVGGVEKRVILKGKEEDGAYETANFLTVTLSCDHRVVDGAVGAEWLQQFKDIMENPNKLLL